MTNRPFQEKPTIANQQQPMVPNYAQKQQQNQDMDVSLLYNPYSLDKRKLS
jgi:hypothetical protein